MNRTRFLMVAAPNPHPGPTTLRTRIPITALPRDAPTVASHRIMYASQAAMATHSGTPLRK